VTSDNAEVVYYNRQEIGRDGEISGPFIDDHEWETLKNYQTGLAVPGEMLALDFIVRNYAQAGGTATSNPTGLLFKGKFTCKFLEWQEETAWGQGLEFPGQNWAMYFEYTWQ
jgi:hypothetical protein